MTDPGAVFLDTNILVYAFDRHPSPKKEAARALVDQLAETGALRTSTQVLQEFYNVVTRKVQVPISSRKALALIDALAAWPVFLVDVPAIRQAASLAEKASLSFWDALIVVAASRSGASVLYTEDMNDGERILGVEIANPFKATRRGA